MRIDLRSDTVTRPSPGMRKAISDAEVGDDCYGDDPTAQRLQQVVAELLGKEAALFVPSGTMANQVALLCHCRPGDEVIVGETAHCYFFEGGAGGAFAGVQFVQAGSGGRFTADEMSAATKAKAYYLPVTRLVALENTHNLSGGRVFPQADVVAIGERARSLSLGVHLDGARLWNAAAATGLSLAELAAPADTVSVCFSKGLGAPVGSALVGPRDVIDRALRYRRMYGGALRQAGVLCAAALYALEHNLERLPEDHANAQRLAHGLARVDGISCDPAAVETNIVNFTVASGDAQAMVDSAGREGVLLGAIGADAIRAVTHRDVGEGDIDRAVEVLGRAV